MKNESISFSQMAERACGLDVHKSMVVAAVSGVGLRRETCKFSTFTGSLIDLRTWLQSPGITYTAFVPPADIRELRDSTRYCRKLTQIIAAGCPE